MTTAEEPRAHVRRPDFPWRDGQRTECGKSAIDVAAVIDRDELNRRIHRDGIQRTAYTVCMTCLDASRRWKDWTGDPIDVMAREFYGGRRDERLRDELRALAALVEAHRDEYDDYMTGIGQTVSLDAARQARRKAAGRPGSRS